MSKIRTKPEEGMAAAAAACGGEHSCATREAILEAARNRFLHYGFKKTTIDEIAQEAGVGKGTVYLHFDSKEEILLTIVKGVKRNITEQMRAVAHSPLLSPEEKLRRMLMACILTVHEAANSTAHGVEFVDDMLKPQLMRCGMEEREAQFALLAEVLRDGIRRGEFAVVNDDTDQAARHLMMAMVSFFPPYANPCHGNVGCRNSLQLRANAMLDFILHGVRRRTD